MCVCVCVCMYAFIYMLTRFPVFLQVLSKAQAEELEPLVSAGEREMRTISRMH